MGKNIVRIRAKKKDLMYEMRATNKSFEKRGIKREAYISPVSQGYVKKLTRKGFPVQKKNFALCVRDKR